MIILKISVHYCAALKDLCGTGHQNVQFLQNVHHIYYALKWYVIAFMCCLSIHKSIVLYWWFSLVFRYIIKLVQWNLCVVVGRWFCTSIALQFYCNNVAIWCSGKPFTCIWYFEGLMNSNSYFWNFASKVPCFQEAR